METMTTEEEWLSQILGESTKAGYKRALRLFKEFMKVDSVEDLVEIRRKERNFETRIIQFFKWLQSEKEVTANSSRAYIIAIQSLFNYVGFPLRLKNKLPKLHMKVETWRPTLEDLQKLYRLGDVSVKAWLSLSRDIPARMSDMLKVTMGQMEQGEFLLLSKKENVIGKCYVSPETQELFRQLRKANMVLPTTQRGVDKMVASACKIAGLPKRINQHLLRKFWLSVAINLGIPEMVYKILSFKSVPQEILTYYLDREDLRSSWEKIVEAIPLESKSNGRVSDLEQDLGNVQEALTNLEKENRTLKVRVENLQTSTENLDSRLHEYGVLLANWIEMGNYTEEEKAIMRKKWGTREWDAKEKERARVFLGLFDRLKNEKGEVDDKEFRKHFAKLVKKNRELWEE